MAAYRVQVLDDRDELVVGATLNCPDDAAARARFLALPLPAGRAELWLGRRLLLRRAVEEA
ncbi:hypothetical protein [Phenylobacterium sp.]|uniref:hypothetical protein n=1 Tax=Phenylobacterium sp. TaxID=1871053 RepID=UPI002D19B3E4|nr:hypothetical protein [Phenylobacterium sp.]HVI30915.1 hypothetical protein [Phenylobacterium sp.]